MLEFDVSDIVEVAIRIEENGAAFYRHAAGIAHQEEVKALFAFLAEEELKHRKLFEEIRSGMTPSLPIEGYGDEYATYLHSYVDNIIVFRTEALSGELAKIRDEAAAFDFAIRRELDSILYYREIVEFLAGEKRAEIERIIEEEKKHFTILSQMKQRLG
jgi:rubrerythrin